MGMDRLNTNDVGKRCREMGIDLDWLRANKVVAAATSTEEPKTVVDGWERCANCPEKQGVVCYRYCSSYAHK